MNKKDKTVVLSKENIIKEYDAIFKGKIVRNFIKSAVFIAYYALFTWILTLSSFYIVVEFLSIVVLYASGVYIFNYYIKNIIELFKNHKMILNGDFTVVTEKVVNSFPKERYNKFLILGLFYNPVLAFYILETKPYRLVFSGFGEYKILSGEYYTTSDIYRMNEKGVYNYAASGDYHYLVVCGKNIALVYNTKMFEYKEN